MKILFLDCDGVLNCETTFQSPHDEWCPTDPYMVLLVDRIVQATGCKIVISSSWRHHEKSVEWLYKAFPGSVIGKIPDIDGHRGTEIKAWIDHEHAKTGYNPVHDGYAILDDDSDMLPEQMDSFFKTSWKVGLTDEIAARVITHFNV